MEPGAAEWNLDSYRITVKLRTRRQSSLPASHCPFILDEARLLYVISWLLQMYPELQITNVMEANQQVSVDNWCRRDKKQCKSHIVIPFKCLGECPLGVLGYFSGSGGGGPSFLNIILSWLTSMSVQRLRAARVYHGTLLSIYCFLVSTVDLSSAVTSTASPVMGVFLSFKVEPLPWLWIGVLRSERSGRASHLEADMPLSL